MSSERRTQPRFSPNRSDRAEFVQREIRRYYRNEHVMAKCLIAWSVAALVVALLLFKMEDAFCCGVATPLLFFTAPVALLIIKTLKAKSPADYRLIDHPADMETERRGISVLVVHRKHVIKVMTWLMVASILAILVCAIASLTGWSMGIAVGASLQIGVCLAALLVATFRAEMYLQALFSIANADD